MAGSGLGASSSGIEDRKGKLHVRKDKDIARQSRIGMVFQRFNLFPHDRLENVMEAPVKVKRQPKADVKTRRSSCTGTWSAWRSG